MKEVKTLNPYIHLLKPKQQVFIVSCVLAYGEELHDFHRGKLPFLSTQAAYNCLSIALERLKGAYPACLPGEKEIPIVGVKFIREIMDIFKDGKTNYLYQDEASQILQLSDHELAMEYGRRYGTSFNVSMSKWKQNDLVHLEKLGKDKWKVTTSKKLLERATTWLTDTYR